MDAFSYLSVLLSIVLGLALQQVLQGYRGLLLGRGRVRPYWPALAWSALVILMVTQNWWASFGLADRTHWSFGTFATILLQVVLFYMMAAVVLPDVPAGEGVDLRAHYYREHRWFFGLMVAMLLSSVLRDWMLDGRLPSPENFAFHLVFLASALALAAIHRARFHEVMTPVMTLVLFAYVALLFARIG